MDSREDPPMDQNLIGAFAAYIRRPKPTGAGMVAQFFGENGDDADTICALSLTKFQDAKVHVEVNLVKDANGQAIKGENGEPPLIASFSAMSRRPVPQKDGMMAQFFAPNGVDADQVVDLGKSDMQDSLVFVQILKEQPSRQSAFKPDLSVAMERAMTRKTIAERNEIASQAKSWARSSRILELSGFLSNATVQAALGSDEDYLSWLSDAPCCGPGSSPCKNKANPFRIPNQSMRRLAYVPLCDSHISVAESGDGLPNGFLSLRQKILAQKWAWHRLCDAVGLEEGVQDPDPKKVWQWAFDRNLHGIIPQNYVTGKS